MSVLVLGGTQFLGRHIIERLAADGFDVVAFHRGTTMCTLPAGVHECFGDRDVDLSPVDDRTWDAIVDVAAYLPAQVERSLALRARQYCFVSSVSAYADLSVLGITEDAPLIGVYDPETADLPTRYGGDKAACERVVLHRRNGDAVILRPGIIAGPWDPTDRFTYWCERAMRGGEILVPAPPDRHVQVIDAADVAGFVVRSIRDSLRGAYNLVGPAHALTMESLLDSCLAVAGERGAPSSSVRWLEPAVLEANGVGEWTDMPFWRTKARFRGICAVDNAKALAAGLELRPLAETVRAVLAWTDELDETRPRHAGLSPEREASVLAAAS